MSDVENSTAAPVSYVPHTFASFQPRFIISVGKVPTSQESFDAGVQAGRDMTWRESNVGGMSSDSVSVLEEKLFTARLALASIARWTGEFPRAEQIGDDGAALSYSEMHGRHAERDFMRQRAEEACMATSSLRPLGISIPGSRSLGALEKGQISKEDLLTLANAARILHALSLPSVGELADGLLAVASAVEAN